MSLHPYLFFTHLLVDHFKFPECAEGSIQLVDDVADLYIPDWFSACSWSGFDKLRRCLGGKQSVHCLRQLCLLDCGQLVIFRHRFGCNLLAVHRNSIGIFRAIPRSRLPLRSCSSYDPGFQRWCLCP
ncbi:MAG: hypothetical protein CH104c_0473 [Candidatus Woesebacteria bacterium]|nr:MAG: hypothetical protein CH104c_0473 [Candidatus Woesebacteria bacterium]